MSGILGRKIGMTSIFDEEGRNLPVTVIEAGPCVVTQIKTVENDGYDAVQLAYADKKEKNTSKAMIGHFKKANTSPKRIVSEFTRFEKGNRKGVGELVTVDVFIEGEYIDVVGVSKGKGFQGVVKRHGFAGVGETSHGHGGVSRKPGSIGNSATPARVFKGTKLPGRMGRQRVKAINLQIIKIIPEKNLLVVKGAVPGPKNGYLKIERWS